MILTAGLIFTTTVLLAAVQGPPASGSLVVKVSDTVPEPISDALGVYTAFMELLLLNVPPVPEVDHVAVVALPPNEAAIVMVLPAQMVCGDVPAFTIGL